MWDCIKVMKVAGFVSMGFDYCVVTYCLVLYEYDVEIIVCMDVDHLSIDSMLSIDLYFYRLHALIIDQPPPKPR